MENYNSEIYSRKVNVSKIIGTFIFFICFLPYLWVLSCGINGEYFGMQDISKYYGFSGMILSIMFGFLYWYPLPFCIIYQIIFFVKCIRHNRTLKLASFILSILFAFAFLLIGIMVNA